MMFILSGRITIFWMNFWRKALTLSGLASLKKAFVGIICSFYSVFGIRPYFLLIPHIFILALSVVIQYIFLGNPGTLHE
jgi:hypothetical protein